MSVSLGWETERLVLMAKVFYSIIKPYMQNGFDDIKNAQTADGGIPDVAPAFWRYYGDNVTWPGTYITVADMLYQQFGDKKVVEKHYPSMKKWIVYMEQNYLVKDLMTKDKYGDWCVPPESLELIHSKDSARTTNGELIASAFYYHLLQK